MPLCRLNKGITRSINLSSPTQYSAISCRVALEDAFDAGLFREEAYQHAPSLSAAHHVIIYALFPTRWLRYVIIYPVPLSHLPPIVGYSHDIRCGWRSSSAEHSIRMLPSFRRIGYKLEMTSTNGCSSTDLLAVQVDQVAPRRITISSKGFQ